MSGKQQFDVWKEDLLPVLQSKVDEFLLLGFERVSVDEIWECALYKLRKQKQYIHLNAFVNAIFSLRDRDYMNWLTIESYEKDDWFANENVLESFGEGDHSKRK